MAHINKCTVWQVHKMMIIMIKINKSLVTDILAYVCDVKMLSVSVKNEKKIFFLVNPEKALNSSGCNTEF